jgi:hypothetical protein
MVCIVVMIASGCSEHKVAPQNVGKQLCLQNPDAALEYYERASKADPANAERHAQTAISNPPSPSSDERLPSIHRVP